MGEKFFTNCFFKTRFKIYQAVFLASRVTVNIACSYETVVEGLEDCLKMNLKHKFG